MEYIVFILFINHIITISASNVARNNEKSSLLNLSPLPNYVVANISNLGAIQDSSIRRKSLALVFPLSEQDHHDIKVLETKFDNEKDCAGLAAPQIGISKRAIVFKVDQEEGIEQGFTKSIWINPSYRKASDETVVAYEQCFSVGGVTAPVRRYQSVHYEAYDVDGNKIHGTAEGFAARVIQHETDHLDGILFIDLVPRDKIITIQEFKRILREYNEEESRRKAS